MGGGDPRACAFGADPSTLSDLHLCAPRARAIGAKLEEWRVADKYVVVKTVVVEQAKKGFSLVASGARKGWAFVKGKVDEARGTPPLPVAEAPEKA